MDVRKELQNLANKYPGIQKINVTYSGSGDNFDDFYEDSVLSGTGDTTMFTNDAEELIWYAIENSDASPDNEGCRGDIIFDFVNMTMTIENYYYIQYDEASGAIVFPEETDVPDELTLPNELTLEDIKKY